MKFHTFLTFFIILFVQCFALDTSIVNRGIAKDVKDAVGKVIEEVKEKVKCVIPRGLSEIARVALLQKCASDEDDGTCYEELGCFPMKDPWVSNLRPVPAPYAPEDINVTLTLFTRNNAKKGWPVDLWPRIVVNDRIYDRRRPRTIFITHGFAASGESDWIIELKDVLLKKLDANIFIVDWKNGSSLINYFQAASNTRVVGAEIGRFANKLIENGLDVKNVYLIGHSLGAHTMGYAAKNIKNAQNATNTNSTRVGRITALDPAQPCFEFTSPLVRLDSEDADFIDVFHTDAKPFLPLFGFGMMSPVGDIDYYFNGGQLQPGCIKNAIPTKFMSLDDIRNMTVEVIDGIVSCSHGRASKYLISSLNHTECGFIARSISKLEKVLNVVSLGIAKLITSPIAKMISKRNDTIVGFEADLIPARGNFLIELANHEPPFCDSSSDFKKLKQNIFQTIRNRLHL